MEAVRILLIDHDHEVNILLNGNNFLCDLVTTCNKLDFEIIKKVFKERKPCINSGKKVPLIQAIIKGHKDFIQILFEHGNPNPYSKDENGISAIHAASAKLDWESFEKLIKLGGDPMITDKDGSTFLHLLCMGIIRDKEYDFAKLAL